MHKKRCSWGEEPPFYRAYHDEEWGVPIHDDRLLFEFLILEGAQAGLSWSTILQRRENYRQAFVGFDPQLVAAFTPEKIEELRAFEGIIRNRLKIQSAVKNANAFLEVQARFGSFDAYLWSFVDGKPLQNAWKTMQEVPAETKISQVLSKDLKQRGFTFVGPVICYAYMQAVGLVNDHLVDCFRHAELSS